MTKLYFKYLPILFLLFISISSVAQQEEMKTDIGFTRGRNIHLWPIFYRDKNETNKKIQAAASLFVYKRDFLNKSVHTHFLPLYSYDSSSIKKDIRIGTFFYPNIFRHSIDYQNQIKTTKYFEIIPNIDFVEFTSSPSGDYLKNNLLFFLWYKKDVVHDKSYLVLFPIYWRFKDKSDIHNVLFPLFTYHKNEALKKSHTWIFPLIFRGNKLDKKTLSFIPIFAYGKSKYQDKTYLGITPFLWSVKKTNSKLNILFPIYWRKTDVDKSDSLQRTVLFPIYFFKNEKQTYSYKNDTSIDFTSNLTLFPIYWNYNYTSIKNNVQKERSHYFGIMPFFAYGKSTIQNKSFLAITPLLWSIKKTNSKLNVFFPVYWRKTKEDKKDSIQRIVLFPFYFSKKEEDINVYSGNYGDSSVRLTDNKTIFPFYWNYNYSANSNNKLTNSSHYFGIMPFYGKGSRYAVNTTTYNKIFWNITPLYWVFKKDGGDVKKLFFPLWWYKNDIYDEYQEKYNVLFPLFWHYSTIFKSDFKQELNDNSTVFFPLYWNLNNRYKHTNIFFPFYFYKMKKYDSTGVLVITPFFIRIKEKNTKTPFLSNYNGGKYNSTTFFPLFSYGNNKADSSYHLVVTPLFWRVKNKEKSSTLLLPLFEHYKIIKNNEVRNNVGLILYRYSKNDTSISHSLIWPLIKYSKSTYQLEFHIAPIIWYNKTKEKKFFGFLPFYYSSKSANYKSFNIFWQLYVFKKMENVYRSHSFIGPLFLNLKFENGDYETRFLYLIYANCNIKGKVVKSIFPFYHYEHDSIGNYSKSIAFSFYNNFSRKVPNTEEFYKEVKFFWFIRLRSNYQYLKNKGIEIDRKKIRQNK